MITHSYFWKLRKNFLVELCCFGLALFFSHTLKAETPPPQEALEAFLTTIRSMEFPVKDGSRHERLVQQANAFLDLEAMAKAALREHWEEATSEGQKIFMDLMWKLIQRSAYPRSHEFLGGYRVIYPEVRQAGNGFEVHSVVKHDEEALDAKVVYHLYQLNNQWRIDDVILDDVSMIEDMSYQFDKIIRESSFSGLLKRMEERLDQTGQESESQKA